MKLKIKKQNTILISLLALSLAACNGGGGGSSGGSSGGDTPPSPPTPPVVYSHNGLTMAIKQVTPNGADATRVNLAKTFGHSQYYLVITNKNDQPVRFNSINYDTYFESTTTKPITTDITKYVMTYDNGVAGVPACNFNSSADYHTTLGGTTLAQGASCAYQLNAMWADNQNTATSIFNWKMSYGIVYGDDVNKYMILTRTGNDCSLFPGAPCASAAEIESADNNQHLSYYLPNHSNSVGTDISPNGGFAVYSADAYATDSSNGPVTNMTGDILWLTTPSTPGYVSQYALNYDGNTNTLSRGALLNTYTGSGNWGAGGTSSNLSGSAYFQYNFANSVPVEPMSVSSMLWHPGLDGAMYASSQNSAYGVLKVTSNGDAHSRRLNCLMTLKTQLETLSKLLELMEIF